LKDSQGRPVILFHLKRFWEGDAGGKHYDCIDLYEEIKAGRKISEWRDNTKYWRKRLGIHGYNPSGWFGVSAMADAIGKRAWFVVGYPKENLPRLEATITEIVVVDVEHWGNPSGQLEIKFKDVVEVK